MARDQLLLERAREMRRNPTSLEQKLWYALRARRFEGAKFRRQVVIDRYVVDFACRIPRKLIVEIDGDTHAHQETYDAARTHLLESRGYQLLRFTNLEVGTNLEGVLMRIGETLDSPSPLPSPLKGRG